jgi:hypothetical protein
MWTKTPSSDTIYQAMKSLAPEQAASVSQGESSLGSPQEHRPYWTESEIDALFNPDG